MNSLTTNYCCSPLEEQDQLFPKQPQQPLCHPLAPTRSVEFIVRICGHHHHHNNHAPITLPAIICNIIMIITIVNITPPRFAPFSPTRSVVVVVSVITIIITDISLYPYLLLLQADIPHRLTKAT